MSKHSFRVYVDESGEEGFVFNADGSGSSRWLVVSAVVTRTINDEALVRLMEKVRKTLGHPPKHPLHFCKLAHQQRIPYLREIAQASLRTVSVLVCKHTITEPEKFQTQKHLLYRYACRFLLERVSWLCRDNRRKDEGDGQAEIVFSNRSQMSYDELRKYLRHLKENSDEMRVTVDWSVINPDFVRAVAHEQLAGLQIADAVASSLFAAVNVNRYGDVEDRYAKLLWPTVYRHKGTFLGYGLKFWPDDLTKLKEANPHLAAFASGD
ncbi:MAG: DUF3800 domain-containing protein [Verrucomicrobiia bacterium]